MLAALVRIIQTTRILIIPLYLFCASSFATDAGENQKLTALYESHWQWLMKQYPTWATSVGGFEQYNDKWSDLSLEAVTARKAYTRDILARIKQIERDKLSPANQLSYDLLLYRQTIELEGLRFPGEYLQLNQMGGVQQFVARTLAMMPKRNSADISKMIVRLEAVPRLIDQTINLMEIGLEKGITPPRITLRNVPQQIRNQMEKDRAKNPILSAFRDLPTTISTAEQQRLQSEAEKTFKTSVQPAYERLLVFITKTYIPGARTSIATRSLPDGEAWYEYQARSSTTTDLTPREVHAIGLREVKRIRQEMKRVIRRGGFKGNLKEFTQFLREDPRFYYEDPERLLAEYRNIAKKADYELPRLFGRLPRETYGVLAVPSYSEKSQPTAYYQSGSTKDGRAGIFFANTYDLRTRPKWEMAALTLHEAVPGHHLQTALAREQDNLPEYRKHGGYTAFVEGWGLYAESLGEEMGLYNDPYSKFGQLNYEMWRAIRLVVDTGIHHMDWSREKAIDYFYANSGKSRHEITVEVDRYIVWPGQALAYKIGELKIKELRALAEQELGEQFDIRAFHDELLREGALPLALLERRMTAWIASQRHNN